ncbi:MAG: hypothetical protein WDO24_14650 [Pseudomonadota bacterium]
MSPRPPCRRRRPCWRTSRPHRLKRGAAEDIYPEHLGFKMKIPENVFDQGEIHNLTISRGTLTEEDRFKVTSTSSRPWSCSIASPSRRICGRFPNTPVRIMRPWAARATRAG